MKVSIITLFPDMFQGVFSESILSRAIDAGLLEVRIIHLREYGMGSHRVVDDTPYGGGGGMILKPEPIAAALEDIEELGHVVLVSPRGRPFRQADALRLSTLDAVTIICGHYEGVDERVSELFVHEEISIGDYVLTGGELPAMVIVDAVARLIPGVLGHDTTQSGDSHYEGLLEYPHYTRPREFRGLEVPDVLVGGNHELIKAWRKQESLRKTRETRPDLLEKSGDGDEDKHGGGR
jgi:tRNA (guanine37-N1)-methyltransferase